MDEKIYYFSIHHRTLIKLLERNFEQIKEAKSNYFDAGYAVIDLNKKTIIDSQIAIDIEKFTGKRFEIFRI